MIRNCFKNHKKNWNYLKTNYHFLKTKCKYFFKLELNILILNKKDEKKTQ